jgi:molybdopterin converting factor small subunit
VKIEVRLFATLARFLPPGDVAAGSATLELPAGSTVRSLVARLGIPDEVAGIVLVNGRDAAMDRVLARDDVVDMFPPLMGG